MKSHRTEEPGRCRLEGERGAVKSIVAMCCAVICAQEAFAGGLAVREQSTSAQGASFAGAAAGGDLSSSFWNPAALFVAGRGFSTESHSALIAPDTKVRTESVSVLPGSALGASTAFPGDSAHLDQLAFVGSSYGAWRVNPDLVLGVAINAPFGSENENDDRDWSGEYHYRAAKLLTVNVNPMLSYRLTPQLSVGAGAQIQYLSLKIKANPSGGLAPSQGNSVLEGDDIGFGFTAGLLWHPSEATQIGLGYRSAISHTVEGSASMTSGHLTTGTILGTVPFTSVGVDADLETPEIVTLSLRQAVHAHARVLATVEWSNWSRLDHVDFIATTQGGPAVTPILPGQTVNVLDFGWDDGWFFSVGAEWDYSDKLTLRAGTAYEISPIRDATQRKINIADSDRIWLSVGATYTFSPAMSFDLAYTHILFEDGPIDSLTTTPGGATTPVRRYLGHADQSADIFAVSLKRKL